MEFDSSVLGYIFDFFAGVFIVFSIIFRSRRKISVESETLYNGNPFVYESQLKAFFDAWIGIIILFIGMILHIFHFQFGLGPFIGTLLLMIIILVSLRLYVKRITEKLVKKRYPHYESVKRLMEEGKYDIYP